MAAAVLVNGPPFGWEALGHISASGAILVVFGFFDVS
jgi:hypothetical protein